MKSKIALKSILLLAASSMSQAWAQTATYEFTGASTADNQFNNVTAAPTGGTFSPFTRTNVNWNAANNVFNSRDWNTGSSIDLAEYVSYSISPDAGNISYLTQIVFGSQRSGTGPTNGQVSLFGNTSVSAISSQAFTPPASIANTTFNFDDVITGEALTVRFYGWGGSSAAGTLRFDNVATTGATTDFQANSADLTLTSGTRVYADASALTLSGNLTGSGGLTKIGSNVVTLSGANDYTGATAVDAGVLEINGSTSASSLVTVNNGGKLAGNLGTVGGNTTIASGGKYSAGLNGAVGSQTFSGDLTLDSGSNFEWELGSETVGTRGTDYDAVNVSGALDVTGSVFKIIVDGLDIGSTFWDSGHTWDVFNKAATGTFGSFELYSASDLVNAVDFAAEGSFSFTGLDGDLKWTVIPEPTSALAGLLLGAGLLRRRRRCA